MMRGFVAKILFSLNYEVIKIGGIKGFMAIRKEIQKLNSSLELKRKIVGIKFLFSEEEFNSYEIQSSNNKLSYCMMVKIASSGKSVKVRSEHFKCNSSTRALGIKNSDPYVASGREYYSYGLYNSLGTAKNVHDKVKYINHELYGALIQPLEKFETEPDIVIIIDTPYTIMRIIQGYTYNYGMAKNIRFAGNQGVCSELTARPYENNDINISLLCSNTRFSCKWEDTEMGVGMPYKIFLNVMQGVLQTLNSTEPDYKKEEIIKKSTENDLELNVVLGKNYYNSSIGVCSLK